ncbi:hypothetical protein FEM48_Zijuj10G0151000 [Ziziphus jujuba var. spinosa]|uniref:Nodulin-like domain-containing protein n=1 Tax=Ziziphus jujuba var. spinosa TaxID=714518 RepID=A0A978UP35_ZIZJJ|nr:hypothetical protein FEM48_Zijuj10G0151000 [Ziziphus jujuba var. spinosa]
MDMLSNKWVATVASIWIQCSIGAYTFGIYTSALNSSQGYDQSILDTVSVFKDIETNIGVLSSLLYSAIAIRNRPSPSSATQLGGPWVVHLAGAFQCFVGYFFMWVVVARVIARPPVMAMCFFKFFDGNLIIHTLFLVAAIFNSFQAYKMAFLRLVKQYLFEYTTYFAEAIQPISFLCLPYCLHLSLCCSYFR